jgi:protease-4
VVGWLLRRAVRLPILLLVSPLLLLRWLGLKLAPPAVLHLRLAGPVAWFPEKEGRLRRAFRGKKARPRHSVTEALAALEEAERLPRLGAVLLELDGAGLGLAQAEELLAALDRVKAAGKKVVVWGEGLSGPGLAVAAAGDEAYGTPVGLLNFIGIRARALFVHDLLGILGVVPQLDHHGDYKTMSDMFQRRTLSDAHREMLTELGGDLFDLSVTPLVVGRGVERAKVEATLDAAPVSDEAATEAGFLDGVLYRDELRTKAGALADAGDDPRTCGPALLLARRKRRAWLGQVFRDRPRVRVIQLSGSIVGGESGKGIPALAAIDAIDDAREDKGLKAVVLRIDSPGGSALASDDIWRAVRRLNEEKPVVASLGRVAASGGYYIAVGARKILAHEATLVGSIGVVSGKFSLGPALRRWGVGFEGVSFGARAGMLDPDRPFDAEEVEANRRELMRFYEVFLSRVAEGRGKTRDEIDAVAQGRVYTGRRAVGLGLVDRIGGLKAAVDEAAALAELKAEPRVERVEVDQRGVLAKLDPRGQAGLLGEGLEALTVAASLSREPALAYCPWWVDGV